MKSTLKILTTLLFLTISIITTAQIAVNTDGSSPDASAILDVTSTDKGILIPRMTTAERTAIASPATGLMVYDNDENSFWYYDGSAWEVLNAAAQTLSLLDDTLTISNGNSIGLDDLRKIDEAGLVFQYTTISSNYTLDVSQTSSNGTRSSNDQWQSFISNYDGYLAQVDVNFSSSNFNGGTLKVYSGEGTSGTLLGQLTLSAQSSGWQSFDLYGLEIEIENSQQYTFRIKEDNNSSFTLQHASNGAYTGGQSSSSSFDLAFRTYYSTDTIMSKTLIGLNETDSTYYFILNDIDTINFTDGSIQTTAFSYKLDSNLLLNNNWLSNDNDSEGVSIDNDGNTILSGTLTIGNTYTLPIIDGNNGQVLKTDGAGILTWQNNTIISDADGDTKIQVEESGDDDIIRFDLHGTEFFRLDSGRVEIVNTGNSVFVGEGAGKNDDYSNNNNVFIGYQSGYNNDAGFENTFLGYESGYSSIASYRNTCLGYQAGYTSIAGGDNVFIGYQAGYSETGNDKLYIDNTGTSSPLIYGDFGTNTLKFNGSVGIGTTPTNGKLEVLGTGSSVTYSSAYGYLNSSGSTGTWSADSYYSIYADGKIGGQSFHAHSDERIKDIQGISNSKEDLNTLMDIEITNYKMKDKVANGEEVTKKVIAQQVKSVYPNAVSTNTIQVIPNIYKTATVDENGWIVFSNSDFQFSTSELKKGDKVQIIFDDKKELLEVLEIKDNAFRVKPITNHQSPTACPETSHTHQH